jgi:hypothetical protein
MTLTLEFSLSFTVKLFTFFFLLLLRCQIEFKCLHTSVYVYIVHVLLLTNIDCNIIIQVMEKKRRNVTMRAKYQNKNCKISLTFTVFVLLFHFVNIWLILNDFRQRHMVFSNKRKLKGNKDKMFIAENLTKYRYDLLRQLNGMKKINKIHSWYFTIFCLAYWMRSTYMVDV